MGLQYVKKNLRTLYKNDPILLAESHLPPTFVGSFRPLWTVGAGQFQFWELTKNMSDFVGVGLPFEIRHRVRGHNNAEKVMLIQPHSSNRFVSLSPTAGQSWFDFSKKMLNKQAHFNITSSTSHMFLSAVLHIFMEKG